MALFKIAILVVKLGICEYFNSTLAMILLCMQLYLKSQLFYMFVQYLQN